MKRFMILAAVFAALCCSCSPKPQTIAFGEGTLTLTAIQDDAVRVQYSEGEVREMPEMVYEKTRPVKMKKVMEGTVAVFSTEKMTVSVDAAEGVVTVADASGKEVFKATGHELKDAQVQGEATREATLTVASPEDEYLYGLGQFQDGLDRKSVV